MDFSFIHAADLHIDSPFDALGRKNAEAADCFAKASRLAVQALIQETIGSGAAFLIIAGDVFDGDWNDISTGIFFTRELVKLARANIPVFMLRGNHDAESRMSRSLRWPDNVREFSARTAESFELEGLRTALHGRGFPDRAVEADFVSGYPPRRNGWLNIGVLHTSLDGRPGHAPYAPCSVSDLKAFGYDYWALGHVHQADIVSRDPWIVYPGNLQGRSIRETGPKGAMRVIVSDGQIRDVQPIELDVARWARVDVAVDQCRHIDDVYDQIRACLEAAHRDGANKPLAARVALKGETELHDRLLAAFERIDEQALGLAEMVSPQCWIEKIRIETTPPAKMAPYLETKSLALDALLEEAAADPFYATEFSRLTHEIVEKLPRELRDAFAAEALHGAGLAQEARHYVAGVANQGARE